MEQEYYIPHFNKENKYRIRSLLSDCFKLKDISPNLGYDFLTTSSHFKQKVKDIYEEELETCFEKFFSEIEFIFELENSQNMFSFINKITLAESRSVTKLSFYYESPGFLVPLFFIIKENEKSEDLVFSTLGAHSSKRLNSRKSTDSICDYIFNVGLKLRPLNIEESKEDHFIESIYRQPLSTFESFTKLFYSLE